MRRTQLLLALLLPWGDPAPSQDVELALEPHSSAVRICDDLAIDVIARNVTAGLSGYQLFLRFPADHFDALRFEPESVDATFFSVGPPPFGTGFAPCEAGGVDPWDDAAGEDVLAIAATVIRHDEGAAGTPVAGDEVLLGRFVFAPRAAASAEEAVFSLNEEICWTFVEQTTLLFDAQGEAIDFVAPPPVSTAVLDIQGLVEDLTCERTETEEVTLRWSLPLGFDAEAIRVYRDGSPIEDLPPQAASFVDSGAAGLGDITYEVIAVQGGGLESCRSALCRITLEMPFRRGDVTIDGAVNISDPVAALFHLFQATSIDCADAADFNDDGLLNISDPIFGLNYLFSSGQQPPEPFEAIGEDPTPDDLGCARYSARS
ncbi:MAG: hypothetical protein JXA90_17130 [Planctomycetes bacterium]|nr:hypothetical protein [Planctomycetota bacterium]